MPEPNQYEAPTMSPPAPPTTAGAVTSSSHQSKWPTVIGIIAIVVGIGGVLTSCLNLASPFLMKKFVNRDTMTVPVSEQMRASMAVAKEWETWIAIINCAGLILGVVLLMAGIGMLSRRSYAAGLVRTWAWLKTIQVAVSAVISYFVGQETMKFMSDEFGRQGQQVPGGFLNVVPVLGVLFVLAWGWALPIFMLIWFSRGRIKDETEQWD